MHSSPAQSLEESESANMWWAGGVGLLIGMLSCACNVRYSFLDSPCDSSIKLVSAS